MSTIEAAHAGSAERGHQRLTKALSNMEEALRLLDEAEAPDDIGAHVDLAVQRLREVIGRCQA